MSLISDTEFKVQNGWSYSSVHFECHTLETGGLCRVGYKWIESLFLHGREGNRDAEFACAADADERKVQLLS